MFWVWMGGYLFLGAGAWLFVLRTLAKRGWQLGELVAGWILIPEFWLAVFFCWVLWPLLAPYVWARGRHAAPPVPLTAHTRPQRSQELDQHRAARSALHGESAKAVTDLTPSGVVARGRQHYDAVLVHGAARAGETVRIVGSDDLRLQVERRESER